MARKLPLKKFPVLRLPLLLAAMLALLAGMWAGLLRLGWQWPSIQPTLPISHGPLMISGFLGTLISLERAVALRKLWAYLAPFLSGLGGIFLIALPGNLIGPSLLTTGSLGLVVIFIFIVRMHPTLYTTTMAAGAACWLAGSLLWLTGQPIFFVVFWWASFLILTIAGERLELSRIVHLSKRSQIAFLVICGLLVGSLITAKLSSTIGVRICGLSMFALSIWLFRFDIARRTVRQKGLQRYIALCLLSGYGWLALGGVLTAFYAGFLAGPYYDAMLHTIFVGFVIGMIFGHAPIIFPSVLNLSIHFSTLYYVPLVLLNTSLILRVAGDLAGLHSIRMWSGIANAAAIVFFLLIMISSSWKKTGNGI